MLRGARSEWSHLARTMQVRPGGIERARSEWLHLEQRLGDLEVLRGAGSEWSHLEQSSDHQQLFRKTSSEAALVYL